jgi:PAP2 superfamily
MNGGASTHVVRSVKPSLAHLGVTSFTIASLTWQAVLGLLTACTFFRAGIAVDWQSVAYRLPLIGVFTVGWLYYRAWPGRRSDWWIPNLLAGEIVMATFALVGLPAQYAAVSAGRPLVDAALARGDAAFGIHLPTLVAWVAQHQMARDILVACYGCFIPEILLLPVVLALLGDRRGLWSFVFQYQLWWSIALVGVALWPAGIAFAYFGISPIIGQEVMAAHVLALHTGTFKTFSFATVEGLISMPSFHASLALLAVWSCRRHRTLRIGVAIVNAIMIIAAALLGLHYVVDIFASLVLFPIGIVIEQALFRLEAVSALTTGGF